MGLFNITNDRVILDPEKLVIPAFKKIWDDDKTKGKTHATRVLTYIYFYVDFLSPYAIYPAYERKKILLDEFLKGDIKTANSKQVQEAISKYKEFQETPSMRLLEAAKVACGKLSDYFMDLDFTQLDDSGRPVYVAKDVAANLKAVGGIIESLDKTEEQVKKEITTSTKIRGGGNAGEYER